jgi:hypothetical protein
VKETSGVRQWLVVGVAVCLCGLAARAEAQPGTFERIWIDVDAAVAVAPADAAMHAAVAQPVELAEFDARYQLPRSAALDVGAGYMLTRTVGVGLSVGATVHEHSAEMSLRIPHPFFPNTFATDLGETDLVMQRIERAVGLHAMFVPVQRRRLRLRVYGGPTLFRISQDAVSEIFYNHFYFVRLPTNGVEITNYDLRRVSGTGWGLHGGADASVFFTRVLGVGGFARYARGTVDFENPLAATLGRAERVAIKAGGLEVGAGIRLKF